jgi:alkylation response protein AidB-like acyl-CoA dehydrogenase
MTVDLVPAPTDEQSMLVDASVRFMESEHPLATVRACADGAEYDDEAYRRTAAELGWFGMLADEAHGGGSMSGNGVLDAALVAVERGARLQPGPFVGHNVVVHALTTSGVRGDVLEELVSGGAWATWVDGPIVADAASCRWLLVSESDRTVLVPADAPGVTLRPLEGLDVTRRWCAVDLADVASEEPVDVPVARLRELAAVLIAAESVGAMQADFDMALQYAKDRIAFGRPIGSFQAIKHLLADTSLGLEMAKGLVFSAATALGSGAPDGAELAHAAKAFVAERGVELAQDCFQVFGGIGYTWEHDQHFFFRRLAADGECFGSAPAHRAQLLDTVGVTR